MAGLFDQLGQIRFRFAFEQPDRARAVSPNKIEKVGRGFRDAQENAFGEGKPLREIADHCRLLRLKIGEPVCQKLLGLIENRDIRSVHEPRGQGGGFGIR